MRKDALIKLLQKHPSFRSRVLKSALEEKPFALLSDIAFSDVVQFFEQHGLQPTVAAKDIARQYNDTDLFYLFITGKSFQELQDQEKKAESLRLFNRIPGLVLDYCLQPMYDPKTAVIVSSCSTALYQRVSSNQSYWKKQLGLKGCNKEALNTVIQADVIQNYKKLYRTLHNTFQYKYRKRLTAWELYCLSGEPKAIDHAMQNENLTRETKGLFGRNALHQAACSGSVEAMKYTITVLKIVPNSLSANGANALLYAAASGSVEAMKYAINVLMIAVDSTDANGVNALHNAAASGSVEAMEYAIEVLKITPNSFDKNGANALHFAARSGSVEAMKYAIAVLKIAPNSLDTYGTNALLHAAWDGSVEGMKYAIELKIAANSRQTDGQKNALHYAVLSGSVEAMKYTIEVLQIAPNSLDKNGANALHIAAQGGCVEAMKYAIEVLKIAANSTDANGGNALLYAAWGGSVEAMKYAIEILKIAPNSTERNGTNALHNAVLSGWVDAVRFVRRLSYELNLKLEPSVRDNAGHDAFWYADKSDNAAAVKEVLNISIKDLLSQPGPKKIGLESKSGPKDEMPGAKSVSEEPQKRCLIM